jgi:4-amino-4-deoxy-L-arabinose transferase-like glycosyltransferase
MLTYSQIVKTKRKDRPWLLVILVTLWLVGTAFFHSPWEPYEPFVFAVVKGIIENHSWLVPYISNAPYLEIQPFYFWLYALAVKLCNTNNIETIANVVRLTNTIIILSVIVLVGKIGSSLKAYKNGRTAILLLIGSIGFINNAYQLSPNILILLGFCLYLYALQLHQKLPGISGGILFVGLLFISINFTCEFLLIAVGTLMLLPIMDKYWQTTRYLATVIIGISLFVVMFFLYLSQLQSVNNDFFLQWTDRYTAVFNGTHYNLLLQFITTLQLLVWYVLPSWFLVIWTLYKRRLTIFKDKILQVNIILALLFFTFAVLSGKEIEGQIFPIVLCFIFLASVEIDSIRITIVSLLNWFSLFLFGVVGLGIWFLYLALNLGMPKQLLHKTMEFTQNYKYHFNIWQLLLAIIITIIWLFLITRRHIRGREMVTNWASGVTYVLVLFLALWLPWFDSILSFKPIVNGSLSHVNRKYCIITNERNSTQIALWYYYANINLMPSFVNIDYDICNQAIIASENIKSIDLKQWNIVWTGKRPIDKKIYYVIKRK